MPSGMFRYRIKSETMNPQIFVKILERGIGPPKVCTLSNREIIFLYPMLAAVL
jgi:hypothetical protein